MVGVLRHAKKFTTAAASSKPPLALHGVASSLRFSGNEHYVALRAANLLSVELRERNDLEFDVWATSHVLAPILRVTDEHAIERLATVRDYGWPPSNNVGVCLAVALHEGSERPGTLAVASLQQACELSRYAAQRGLRVRASLLGAFGTDLNSENAADAELKEAASALAEAGVDALVLDDRHDHLGSLAEAEAMRRLERAVEVLVGLEAPAARAGKPNTMAERIGLRLAGSTALGGQLSAHAAISLGVRHLEACPFGEAAPQMAELASACADAGLPLHGVDVQQLRESWD